MCGHLDGAMNLPWVTSLRQLLTGSCSTARQRMRTLASLAFLLCHHCTKMLATITIDLPGTHTPLSVPTV